MILCYAYKKQTNYFGMHEKDGLLQMCLDSDGKVKATCGAEMGILTNIFAMFALLFLWLFN